MNLSLENISLFLASIALVFFIADATAQLLKLNAAKTSKEISTVGLVVRILGMSFFVLRFGVMGDKVLFFGQSVLVFINLAYGLLVLKYRKR